MRLSLILMLCCLSSPTLGVEYDCGVEKKFDSANIYTKDMIEKSQFSVRIEEESGGSYLSRCSFTASAGSVTCDRYAVDKVVFDENVRVKKFYVFSSQFDVQLFQSLFFLENNGRGGIAFGTCRVVSP